MNDKKDSRKLPETEEPLSFETRRLEATSAKPDWADQDQPGASTLYDSSNAINVNQGGGNDATDFVDATDFTSQRLLRIESVGPNGCYDQIDISRLVLKDETIVGRATAAMSNEGMICTEVITYPRILVRVDTTTSSFRLKITNGWGETGTTSSRP
jgi:hypothetical protein